MYTNLFYHCDIYLIISNIYLISYSLIKRGIE